MSDRLADLHPWLAEPGGYLNSRKAEYLINATVSDRDNRVSDVAIRSWCRDGYLRYTINATNRFFMICRTDIETIAAHFNGSKATTIAVRVLAEQRKIGPGADNAAAPGG